MLAKLKMNKMGFSEKFTIQATAPFDFDLTAQIFRNGNKQIRTYSNGEFSQLFRIDDKLVLAKLKSKGTVQQPRIEIALSSNNPVTTGDQKRGEKIARFIFNLDFNLTNFCSEIKKDQTMHKIAQQLYGDWLPFTL